MQWLSTDIWRFGVHIQPFDIGMSLRSTRHIFAKLMDYIREHILYTLCMLNWHVNSIWSRITPNIIRGTVGGGGGGVRIFRFLYPTLSLPEPLSPDSRPCPSSSRPLWKRSETQNTSYSFSCTILRRFLFLFSFDFSLVPLTLKGFQFYQR